jgi:arylsulfatase A-like enzyme
MNLTFLASLMICCAAQAVPPNVIYINTDDWGIGKVPCYKMDPASQEIIKPQNLE